MARKCMIVKALKQAKYSTRQRNRCSDCGRPRAFLRFFGLCRICFRKNALAGLLPGVCKASW